MYMYNMHFMHRMYMDIAHTCTVYTCTYMYNVQYNVHVLVTLCYMYLHSVYVHVHVLESSIRCTHVYTYIHVCYVTCLESVSLFSEELDTQRAWYMARVYGTDSGHSYTVYMHTYVHVYISSTHVHVQVSSLITKY